MRLAAALVAALVLVSAAAAKDGVLATITSRVPMQATVGTKFVVAFTLKDAQGHPFNAEHVFVKVICPERDVTTIAFASRAAHPTGRYRVVATVPAGGIGTVRIGLRGSSDVYFPVRRIR